MPAVLRNGRTVGQQDEKPESSKTETRFTTPTTMSRPSTYLLLIYPVILAIGSLYSVLSPIAAPPVAPLAPGVTSEANTPSTAPVNYFSTKRNIFNVYFVKRGWFWMTLAFVLLQITTRPPPAIKQKHYLQAALRYTLATFSWFLTTQWCFGPALIDRSFTITGGRCEPHILNTNGIGEVIGMTQINSGPVCKAVGGRWKGGHDISGHVFILTLASAFLIYELYISDRDSSHPHVSPRAAAAVAHDMTEEERKAVGGWESETVAKVRMWSRYILYGVVVLDFWMLMMTAIWFHTWQEKLSGLLIAGSTLYGIYFLGHHVPEWRSIAGGL
ncbi:inositol phospholipid synthesis and fat-storage-inducing TM-domain-containing protein [Exophiala viscosa]|uniref:inositol phospholipid synthesis and fat-storage-inducing TM-domain-containing protein n=1 Tax=Exophiala viscosa TaxID=2486360 RepID=UPI002199B49B|nr:inositol phospholipid synthesis and fat-storage-inducing TM-domain-containing protein [Exophiala viscosa]